ncbi:TonB-dependent receptor [Sphingopyxis sp. DHUNG17]|uniref:TonB-dependent receptor n=1 Tax=Sphingopyxis jiangsuensis TaxID=2871171 RepID=UPI00191E9FE1|nr:TonB-dependent receptor [Sphingopyxis lutea]MBL0768121.1 TonB-dependent receptor [Sphingopyxis lutea]
MIDALILASSLTEPVAQPESQGRLEIVVTGERVPRSIMETASSVAVEDSQTLNEQAVPDRVDQILQSVPNVQLGSGGEGPVIRGQDSTGVVRDLPAFLSGTRPRTTIRVDGRSATYYELAFGLTSIWDIDRVEVFRSPQTTTQGRNSIGGAIFVETNDPTFEWEGHARLIAGDYSTRQAAAVISAPLADDQLAIRLSGDLRRSRTSSKITSIDPDIDANRDDSELIRVKFLAEPTALPDTRLVLTYSHGHSSMPQIEGIKQNEAVGLKFEDRRDPNATYGVFSVKVDSLTGRFAYQPAGGFEAKATVSYGKADVHRRAPSGFGDAHINAKDYSVEPVLAWHSDEGWNLTGGMNYTRATQDQTINLAAFPRAQGIGAFSDTQNSLGFFGEGEIPLSSNVILTLGLRYQYDKHVRQGLLSGNAITLPLDYDRTFTAWLPKASVAWDITPDLRVGVLAQRAFNPGGVNLNLATAQVESFVAEHLWDYELFARARLADGRLVLTANVFRYDMTETQRSTAIPVVLPGGQVTTIARVDNSPRAWSKGAEVELDWRPSSKLHLRGAVGLLDTRITRTVAPTDLTLGKQFQRSPHFSGSASATWTPLESVMLSAQVRHNSSYFSDDLETAAQRVSASTTIDAKASWTWQRITMFGYVRNLFDEFHLTYRFTDPASATAGDPREWGLGLEMRF